MVEPLVHGVPADPRDRGEDPSFLMVVLLSGVVLALFFIVGFFVLRATAADLLPGGSHPDRSHSVVRMAEPPVRAA